MQTFGIDFLKQNRMGTSWSTLGNIYFKNQDNQILIELVNTEIDVRVLGRYAYQVEWSNYDYSI